MPDSQPDVSELAREVVVELEDTRQIGDQLLLSRREAIALSTGAVSLGALGVAGAGSASAQEAAGQIGTASDPVDVEGAQGNFQALEAESVSTDELYTEPAGVLLTKTDPQTVSNDITTKLTWDDAVEFNDSAPDFADITNNQISIPSSDYSFARIVAQVETDNMIDWVFLAQEKNGSRFDGRGVIRPEGDFKAATITTNWVPVAENDDFEVVFRHDQGNDEDIAAKTDTWVSLEAI